MNPWAAIVPREPHDYVNALGGLQNHRARGKGGFVLLCGEASKRSPSDFGVPNFFPKLVRDGERGFIDVCHAIFGSHLCVVEVVWHGVGELVATVGGGAQLATIVAMVNILQLPRELAVSAGILLWLVCFHSVTPIGLLIARRADVSLQSSGEKERQDQAVTQEAQPLIDPCYQENAA